MTEDRQHVAQTPPQGAGRGRKRLVAGLIVGTLVSAGAMLPATQSSGQTPELTAWFTQEQAERGDAVFVIECGGCHGYELASVLAEATTAADFYGYISTTMPWENPGALLAQQYADIVAFFLSELGFPAGEDELPPDTEILAQIIPTAVGDVAQAAAVPAAPAAGGGDEAAAGLGTWYTAEQADQGERDFAIACGGCHGADMVELFAGYDTVADYMRFITGAMPADDPGNLAMRQYLAITAYLMREVGFPAGDTELINDRELLGQIVPGAARE